MPLSDFMRRALGDPAHGYYRVRDPIGAAGDFVTAPEISQAFGELIGLWAAVLWQDAGRPAPVRLVELGPGRGTLMADALRATAAVPGFEAAIALHLVETDAALAALQRTRLGAFAPAWHARFDEVPEGFAVVIANEFFDALPVDQYVRRGEGWTRRAVAIDGKTGALALIEIAAAPPAAATEAREGAVVEISAAARTLASAIAGRIARTGGALLAIDYGPARHAAGESLQAVRAHRFHAVLEAPGLADLSAHVDFAALAHAAVAAGARVFGPIGQRSFLRRLGIEVRLARLAAADRARAADVLAAGARLIDATGMGTLFKVLCIIHPEATIPAGFQPGEEWTC
ncbi:MAG: class I SAM-dependent methyltransferase [Alphaproteobacteria bacterium]|nr:class I SAM-dependent methyltransferase [Alphaproteobacteria bacterium]